MSIYCGRNLLLNGRDLAFDHANSMTGIKEEKLNDIVNAIGSDHDTLMNLGFALGFLKVSIDKYDASNNKRGKISTAGTRDMVFDWKRNTSPEIQKGKLREALIKAKLTEIADTYLPISHETKVTTLKTSETQTVGPSSLTTRTDQKQSPELLCLKCDRVTANIRDVINTKISDEAIRSKVRDIKGKECLVQLMVAEDQTLEEYRYDVISLTVADVKVDDEVFPSTCLDGYNEHRCTWCKGCSEQVGWYFIPTDGKSAPFHTLFLQCLIHDSYDSDNSLNAFFAQLVKRLEE